MKNRDDFYLKAIKYLCSQGLNFQKDFIIFLGVNTVTARIIFKKLEESNKITIGKTGRKKTFSLVKDIKLTTHDTYFLLHKNLTRAEKIMLMHIANISNAKNQVTMFEVLESLNNKVSVYKAIRDLMAKGQIIKTRRKINKKYVAVIKLNRVPNKNG